ncbi:MAG: hypothetical protein NTX29_15085 [Actinobacteria bacterium]|nr:hypothetical protein [Actinomycetota bacterium]
MGTRGTRHVMTLAAVAASSALLLASCSSTPEETPTPSASLAPSSASAEPSASATEITPTGAAALACAAYFDLDLLNSQYAGGAVADGDMTEQQVRADFRAQLKELVTQANLAADDGSGDAKLAGSATRMKKIVKGLSMQQALSELSKKQQRTFAKSSLRVQKACDRAGFPLPADNVTARTAAGL